MQNSYDIKSSGDTTVTVPHERMHESETNKATESTSLSPNNNQTYFADEKVQVPETTNVSRHLLIILLIDNSISLKNISFSI